MSEQESARKSVSGILVIDKPLRMTSHDVVEVIRQGTRIRRAGHTGTLDPRASGVLVVLLGSAVRLSEYISTADKRYQAEILLGQSTDTYDAEGIVTRQRSAAHITEEQFLAALDSFSGAIEQVPPPYSAIKVKGRKAYDLAREGKAPELPARAIHVYSLELLEWAPPEAVIDIACSSGTYVRSLANDLGEKLGCGAHLIGLRRTSSGHFSLRDAVTLGDLRNDFENGTWYRHVHPAADALRDWPSLVLSESELEQVRHGRAIPASSHPGDLVCALTSDGDLAAVLKYQPDGPVWQPDKVFFT